MRVAYVTPLNLPTRYANSIQVMKNARAWAKICPEFELITCPSLHNFRNNTLAEIFDGYGIQSEFKIIRIPINRLHRSPHFLLRSVFYTLATLRCLSRRVDFIHTRSYLMPWFSLRAGIPTAVETHGAPTETEDQRRLRSVLNHPKLLALIVASPVLGRMYVEKGCPEDKVLVCPNGFDADQFARPVDPAAIRRELGLSDGYPVVGYVGHLYDDRGITEIFTAASRLPDARFLIVGGHDNDVARRRAEVAAAGISNVTLTGHVPHGDVPRYLAAADVLVMPYSPRCPTAAFMTPVKLAEYMAAGKAIVASDLPSLSAVIHHERNGLLCAPDDDVSLTRAIARLLADPELRRKLGTRTAEDVRDQSWDNRIRRIHDFVRSRIPAGEAGGGGSGTKVGRPDDDR